MCVFKKVSSMSLSVDKTLFIVKSSTATSAANKIDEINLFEGTAVKETNNTSNADITKLEAQLAQLESELATLEADKAEKEAYKKELEAQKRAIEAQKRNIEAQIEANEAEIKQNEEIIKQNEANIEKAQKEIEELEEQYNAKNQEAEELNQQINDKISKIIADSDEDVQELSEKIRQATEEAQEKVASGEIKESEVSQYVAQKVGNSSISASTADFAAVISMNLQLRALINGAKDIYNQMSIQQTEIAGYQANIANAINANTQIAQKNAPLQEQLNELNSQEKEVNKEINSVNSEIAAIDTNIANVKAEINTIQQTIDETKKFDNNYKLNDKFDINDYIQGSASGEDQTPETKATTTYSNANPFLSISYDNTQYLNMTDALDAMAVANDQNIQNAQSHVESNREQIRKMFQDLIK